jgi:hypothetical protein
MDSDAAFAFPSQNDPLLGLTGVLGLAGEPNNPPVPPESNSPGLDSQTTVASTGVKMKSSHWVIVIVIVLALLFGWYWYSGSVA